MRFLILTQYFAPEIGAPQTRLAALTRELLTFGHEVEIVTAPPHHLRGAVYPGYANKLYVRDEWEGCTVHRTGVYVARGTGVKRLLNYLSFTASCWLGLRRAQKPDFLFVESPPLFLGIPALWYGRRCGVPVIFNVADPWPDAVVQLGVMRDGPAVRAAYALERWIYRHADFVNAVTDSMRSMFARKGVPAEKVLFMPNGVDTARFTPRPPDRELRDAYGLGDDAVILYTGTHGIAHGLEHIIWAATRLKDLPLKIVFVGDGEEKARLMLLAQEFGLANVRFVPSQPLDDMPRWYSIATASIISLAANKFSREARSSKTFPSLACGVPVIFSGDGEAARILRDADAALLGPPDDAETFEKNVRRIVTDAALRERLGKNGRRYVEANYDWREIARRWLAELAERSGRRELTPATRAATVPRSA